MKTRSDVTVILDDQMGNEEKIVRAAQVSTKGKEVEITRVKDPARFVKWLIKEQHGSPFEHVYFSFYLEVPIFISRQIVKYRLSSINEHSGRYSEFDAPGYVPAPERPLQQVGKVGDYEFVNIDQWKYEKGLERVQYSYDVAQQVYGELLDLDWAREMARIVLPTGTYSCMFVTMNLRNWLHFVAQRATLAPSHGQYEIAMVADQVLEVIREYVPNVVEQFEEGGYASI